MKMGKRAGCLSLWSRGQKYGKASETRKTRNEVPRTRYRGLFLVVVHTDQAAHDRTS